MISLNETRWRKGRSIFSFRLRSAGSILAIAICSLAQSPTPTPTPNPAQEVPVIDGGAGPCSVEFTVTDANAKPQYDATVKVHIAYGFAGVRKLDLEAGTNINGKVKFKGLPVKVHNPPLEFNASKGQLTGIGTYNPAAECEAKHDIMLDKPKPVASKSPQSHGIEKTQPLALSRLAFRL